MQLRLSLVAISLFIGCSGEIVAPGAGNPAGNGGPSGGAGSGGSSNNSNGQATFPPECTNPPGGGAVPCQVTAQCAQPYVCIGGVCQPPSSGQVTCDVDRPCAAGTCTAGVCERVPGNCTQNQDCPTGMQCQSGACVPSGAPPTNCASLPAPPNLAGTWHETSTLHFRQALSSPLALLLDAGQVGRDLVTGNLGDLGVPGFIASILGPIVSSVIDQYVPAWAQQFLIALGDLHDILDNMRVKSDVTLTETCQNVYHGSEVWTRLEFTYRGMMVSKRPEDIPEIGQVRPEDFSARVLCGELYVDRHRIRNAVGGLLRWVLDTVVNIVTCADNGPCYNSPEDAVNGIVDCDAIAQAIDDALSSAIPFAPSVYGAVDNACNGLKNQITSRIQMAIDQAVATFSVVSLAGQAHVAGASTLDQGVWAGSLVGSDFPGEWTANK